MELQWNPFMLKVEKRNGGEALINPNHIAYIETRGKKSLRVVLDCPHPYLLYGGGTFLRVRLKDEDPKAVLARWGEQISQWMAEHRT